MESGTINPITSSWWYEHRDGTVGLYRVEDEEVINCDLDLPGWKSVEKYLERFESEKGK